MMNRQRLVRSVVVIVLAMVVVPLCASGCAKREKYAFALRPIDEIATSVPQEIDELLAFFQGWYRGDIPNTDAEFDRLDRVLHDDFTIVNPEGDILVRRLIASDIRRSHGVDADALVFETNVRAIYTFGRVKVYRYEEHQTINGESSVRISTAVFLRDGDAPNGVVWLRVQETFTNDS